MAASSFLESKASSRRFLLATHKGRSGETGENLFRKWHCGHAAHIRLASGVYCVVAIDERIDENLWLSSGKECPGSGYEPWLASHGIAGICPMA
jgi:hypothetical protein